MSKPNPVFKSLQRKLWLRRWSVSAPKMTIKSHLPWPLRAIFIAVVLGLSGAIAMWAYDAGRNFTGFGGGPSVAQVHTLRADLAQVSAERDEYRTTINATESQLNIEKSVQSQLLAQIKSLESQNGKLKEDLAFFEGLLPTDTGAQGISIRRLKVEMVDPAHIRYRLLLMQGGKNVQDFDGHYQLLLSVVQNGKNAMLAFPKPNAVADYRLSFKHYQRVEGVLELPPDTVVQSAQIKILERGVVRAQQSENL